MDTATCAYADTLLAGQVTKHSHALSDLTPPLSLRAFSSRSHPEHFFVFYRWPTMRHFRFISRFKVYQVSAVILLLPPVTYWYSLGHVGGVALLGAWSAALGTTAVFCVISTYFRRFVGEMAFLPSTCSLRVSTLTFMGGRRDLVFPVDDIVPFDDSQVGVGGAFQRLEVQGHRGVFLYSLKYGVVLDSDAMGRVLGIAGTEK